MSAHVHDPDTESDDLPEPTNITTVRDGPRAYVRGGAISDTEWSAWQAALARELATMTPAQRAQWTR